MCLPRPLKNEESPLLLYQNTILPLCFVFLNLTHLFFFYLGLGYIENPVHEYGYIFLCVLFAVFCGLIFLNHLLRRVLSNVQLALLAALLLYFFACYVFAFRRYGLHGDWLHYGAEFVILSLPALFAGVCGGLHGGEKNFFSTLEQISPAIIPLALAYFLMTLVCAVPESWGNEALGIFNYMRLAYFFMPFLLAHIVGFASHAQFVFLIGCKPVKHPNWIRAFFIVLYSLALIATATRGAYICVFGFCVLFILFSLLKRELREAKRVALVLAFLIAVMTFLLYIYTPTGLARVSRMKIFTDGLRQGNLITTTVDEHIEEKIDGWVSQEPSSPQTPPADEPQTPPADDPQTPPADDPFPENSVGDVTEGANIGSRGVLFNLAIKEFLKSPLTGMGPTGYSVKYGMYPHNVLLELLCETGIVGFLPLFGLILWAFVRLAILSWKRKEVQHIFLFFLAYAIHACLSGTIWRCSALMCALGYAITATLPARQCKKE